MNINNYVYVFSVSLQIVGALIITWNFWNRKIDRQIEEEQKKNLYVEEGILIVPNQATTKEKLMLIILQNRISAISIILGYVIGIFGDNDYENKISIFIYTIVVSFVLFIVIELLSNYIVNRKVK